MKSIETILAQEPVYLNRWKSKIDLISDFDNIYMTSEEYEAESPPYANVTHWEKKKVQMKAAIEAWSPINILLASYGYEDYSGGAFVLFERDGKLYEVHGSHCSCFGLEGQFEPEETTLESLEHRLVNGKLGTDSYCGNEFSSELKSFLGTS